MDRALADGAKAVLGGRIPEHLPKGYYYEPTIIVGADENSAIAQEELFGPVLVVLPHDGDDDAIRVANNSIFGLSGAVMSADNDRALRVARRIRTGTISVNGGMYYGPDSPVRWLQAVGHGARDGRREHGRVPGAQDPGRAGCDELTSPRCACQWATGNIGGRALREVIRHPDLELVGVLVYDPDKAGVDAGVLCGEEPVGIAATTDPADIQALGADCVLYMPRTFDVDDRRRHCSGRAPTSSPRAVRSSAAGASSAPTTARGSSTRASAVTRRSSRPAAAPGSSVIRLPFGADLARPPGRFGDHRRVRQPFPPQLARTCCSSRWDSGVRWTSYDGRRAAFLVGEFGPALEPLAKLPVT